MTKVYHVVTLVSDNEEIEIETSSEYDNFSSRELGRFAFNIMKNRYKMTDEEADKFTRMKIRKGRKG